MKLIAIGLMSGSSMDGIDAVLIETNGQNESRQLAKLSVSYKPYFRILLRAAEQAVRTSQGNIQEAEKKIANYLSSDLKITLEDIITESTLLHANLVKDLIKRFNIDRKIIDVIGYHGQNLHHNPAKLMSIQIGDGKLLADETDILVINNFRINDIKNGGQGAPLAPIYHQALALQQNLHPLAIVNCGGISNITIINGAGNDNIAGFDIGPGNILIDQYVRKYTKNKEFMDENGKYGSIGTVSNNILALLKEKSFVHNKHFLQTPPPKSLDSMNFILIPELDSLSFPDACATLEAFTAESIVTSIPLINTNTPKKWILAGGGWNNPVITRELKQRLINKIGNDLQIMHAAEIGWDGQYMEAEIFAYLAVRHLCGLPISVPQITGAKFPSFAGNIYIPKTGNLSYNSSKLMVY